MNILISGESGYLGFNIKKLLSEYGYSISIVNKNYTICNPLDNYDVFLYFSNPNEIYFNKDPKNASIDMINHFYHIKDTLEKTSVKHVIYASTVRVYDDNKNVYANSHLYIENLLESFCSAKNIFLTKSRFGNIFGGTIDSMIRRDTLVPHVFVKNILETNILELHTNGEQFRDFTPISLVYRYIEYIIKNKPDCIDICSGHNFKIIEIVKIIKDFFPNANLQISQKSLNESEKKYNSIIQFSKNEVRDEIRQTVEKWISFYAS